MTIDKNMPPGQSKAVAPVRAAELLS